ncbi:unnamed protein product [Prorocentrum cordatum]|uniref:Uncharacterized protein n=1 Tax=Prorocentrum cordatum TaxID=2364126 RepID=A0ABN9U7F4_9DINO|nr:unnamed protein product [Polarella glacialis]
MEASSTVCLLTQAVPHHIRNVRPSFSDGGHGLWDLIPHDGSSVTLEEHHSTPCLRASGFAPRRSGVFPGRPTRRAAGVMGGPSTSARGGRPAVPRTATPEEACVTSGMSRCTGGTFQHSCRL